MYNYGLAIETLSQSKATFNVTYRCLTKLGKCWWLIHLLHFPTRFHWCDELSDLPGGWGEFIKWLGSHTSIGSSSQFKLPSSQGNFQAARVTATVKVICPYLKSITYNALIVALVYPSISIFYYKSLCQILCKNPSFAHRAGVKIEVKGQMEADHLKPDVLNNA